MKGKLETAVQRGKKTEGTLHDLQVRAGVLVTVTIARKDERCVRKREREEVEERKKR